MTISEILGFTTWLSINPITGNLAIIAASDS